MTFRVRCAQLACLPWILGLIVLPAHSAAGPAQEPRAKTSQEPPSQESPGELAQRLRSARGAQQRDLFDDLQGLSVELEAARELLRHELLRLGYGELVAAGAAPDLDELLAQGAASDSELEALLGGGGESAELRARYEADLAPRVGSLVLAGHGAELVDLRGGLALLLALGDGFVWLRADELEAVCARVELSAYLLRAMAHDASELAQAGARRARFEGRELGPSELLAAVALSDPGARRRRLVELRAALERGSVRLAADLATGLLRERRSEDLQRRANGRVRAQELVVELRRLAPYTPEGGAASEALAELAPELRYGLARRTALEAISCDPLAAEPAYHVGRATDFLEGLEGARAWLERYLALRGIRAHSEDTHRDRELSDPERFALQRLLRLATPR